MRAVDKRRPHGDPAGMHTASSEPAAFALHSGTPPWWGGRVRAQVRELLVDQGHLEKKAAAAANRFLFVVPQDARLQRALSALAREELVHFERTLHLCGQRGIAIATQQPAGYAAHLKAACDRDVPGRLVDELLVAALIETRSCERMQCLALALRGRDEELAAFYRELVAAEARHHLVYVEVAAQVAGAAAVAARWQVLAAHEARVLAGLPFTPHLHGGTGDGR